MHVFVRYIDSLIIFAYFSIVVLTAVVFVISLKSLAVL